MKARTNTRTRRRLSSACLVILTTALATLSVPAGRGHAATPAPRWISLANVAQPADFTPYVGAYLLAGQRVIVAERDGSLTVTIPGQPTYTLQAIEGKPHEFKLLMPGGLDGYSLVFEVVDGLATTASFHQPEGVFPAMRERPALGADNPDVVAGLRQFIEQARQDWQVPGLAVGIIHEGKVILEDGFGLRDVDANLPVTPRTRFGIGSATKPFTAAVLGSLVAEGTLEWDKPVRTYWPSFTLKDDFASMRMTPRDLVTHRSGLPRHDLAWYGSPRTRAQLMDAMRHLEPTADLRVTFQYNNFMFTAAGYLIEQLTSKTWEQQVQARIFDPLGMTDSTFSITGLTPENEATLGYEKKDGKVLVMPYKNIDSIGPAGSINSSLRDMLRWTQLMLNQGEHEGKAVLPADTVAQLHNPQMVIDKNSLLGQILFDGRESPSYALGWFVSVYQGHVIVEHGGNIDGFSALVSMIPENDIGVVVLTNMNGTMLTEVIAMTAYDRLLKLSPTNWDAKMRSATKVAEAAAETLMQNTDAARVAGTSPSHALDAYAGNFENPGYGSASITLDPASTPATLRLTFNGISSALAHWHYEIFELAEKPAKGLKVSFQTDTKGDVTQFTISLEAGTTPLVFSRQADPTLANPEALKKYVGKYTLMGVTITVQLRGNTLTVTVPGQPTYDLIPMKPHAFDLKMPGDVKGYSLRFTMQGDTPTEAIFIQPEGTFPAKRAE